MPKKEKMIEIVAHLLDLSDSSSYEAETNSAAEKAAELMAKYQISYQDLSREEKVDFQTQDGGPPRHKHDYFLENAVAKLNGVLFLLIGRKQAGRSRVRLIGTKTAIESHTYMMDLIASQREHSWAMYKDSLFIIGEKTNAADKKEWLMGYAYGVNEKVHRLMEAASEKQQEWGLVPVDAAQEAQNWYENQKNRHITVSNLRRSRFNNAGWNSGKDVNMNKGVSASNKGATYLLS